MHEHGRTQLATIGSTAGRLLGGIALASLLALSACGSDSGDDGAKGSGSSTTKPSATSTTAARGGSALDGQTFTSTSVDGFDLQPGTEIRLSFDGSNLAAHAGCNSMRGPYAFEGGELRWTGEPAATMMACQPELMDQDTWLAGLLTGGVEVEQAEGTLTLTADGVRIELVAEADATVVGTTWTLDGIVEGDAVSSLPAGVEPPTLEIAEDGTATVFAGCNRGGTKVEITDTTLVFEPLGLTMMACEGDAAAVEASVIAVLDGSVDLAVDGESLTLGKGAKGLVFRAS